jgi:predicted acetyltransferase
VTSEIRPIGLDELPALLEADQRAFGHAGPPPEASQSWSKGELDRTRVAFDDGGIVGACRNYTFELTMPGGSFLPAAAVSWVGVLPTHRRRGIVTQLMAALHDDARAHDEPLAMLTASEGAIYGRFGYGIATWRLGLLVERARVQFASVDDGRMRLLTREAAQTQLPGLYDRMRPLRAGMVSRPDFWWPQVYWEYVVEGKKACFFAVHTDAAGNDDGYVAYEITGDWAGGLPDKKLHVWDLQAIDGRARAALWRYVFGVDLVGTVEVDTAPIDDPLRWIVRDSRRVRVDYVNDGLWIAPLDCARVLAAREYAVDGVLNFAFVAPDGTRTALALDGGPDGAKCTPTSAEPDIACSTAALGACILGGNRWTELAQAGLVEANDPAALLRGDAMFLSQPAPALLSGF